MFCLFFQIRCQKRSKNRQSRSQHPPNPCRVSPRRPATPPTSLCGSPGQTAWSTCGIAAPALLQTLPRPPSPPIWWTWWVMSFTITSHPAPPPPAASLSLSSASMRWWTGPSARAPAPRTTPPVWWTWQPLTRWPSATNMHCSMHPGKGRSWMMDSYWWPMGRRCWKKGLRSDGLMPLLWIQKEVFCLFVE